MRVLRFFLPLGVVTALALMSLVLLSGCSNDSTPTKAQVDASKHEQELLHDQIQKGFAKKPATKRK